MRRTQFLRAILVTCVMLGSISAQAEVLAKVGSDEVTREEFEQKASAEETRLKRKLSRDEREGLLRSIANQRLLVAEARKRGLHKDKALRYGLDEQERQALANMVYNNDVAPAGQVDDDELRKLYAENPRLFEQRRVSQILIEVPAGKEAEAQAKALTLGKQLSKEPGAFARLAKAQSADKLSNKKGGDLGWLRPGQLVAELAQAIFNAKLNTVIGPVRTQFGLHYLIAKQSKQLELKDVAQVLRQELSVARETQKRQAFLDALAKKHGLKINVDKL